jgi:hypothetical protein
MIRLGIKDVGSATAWRNTCKKEHHDASICSDCALVGGKVSTKIRSKVGGEVSIEVSTKVCTKVSGSWDGAGSRCHLHGTGIGCRVRNCTRFARLVPASPSSLVPRRDCDGRSGRSHDAGDPPRAVARARSAGHDAGRLVPDRLQSWPHQHRQIRVVLLVVTTEPVSCRLKGVVEQIRVLALVDFNRHCTAQTA